MGMTIGANPVALPADPESFLDYAFAELQAASLNVQGECFNPDCSKPFNARLETQIYCSTACQQAGVRELRKWGHKAAWPLLYWRTWKRETDPARAGVVKAARRYLTHLQTEWFEQRRLRKNAAKERQAIL